MSSFIHDAGRRCTVGGCDTMRRFLALALALSGCLLFGIQQSVSSWQGEALPYKNPSLPIEKRVDDRVSRMTLQEKVSQMMNAAPAIDRLGIPEYERWNEGLHGVARA